MNRRKAAIGYVTYVVAKEVGRRAVRKRYQTAVTPRRARFAGLLAATAATAVGVVVARRLARS